MELKDELSAIYLRTMFELVAQRPFEHLHWGYWRDVEKVPERFAEAQAAYAERLVSLVPGDAHHIVDVGCGLGGIARALTAAGRRVIAITPDAHHAALLADSQLEVREGRFEDLSPERSDCVLFAESLSFFPDSDALIERTKRWLGPNGYLLAAELMSEATHAALAGSGELLHDEDITDDVRFTVEVLQHRLDRYVSPYRRGLLATLAAHDPRLSETVARVLGDTPNVALRRLMAGEIVEADMLADRRYRVMLIRYPQK